MPSRVRVKLLINDRANQGFVRLPRRLRRVRARPGLSNELPPVCVGGCQMVGHRFEFLQRLIFWWN
jgi:hypothetical protein